MSRMIGCLVILSCCSVVLGMVSSSSTGIVSSGLSDSTLRQLTDYANSYAAANGLQVEKKQQNDDSAKKSYQCAPISLLPNIYPASAFRKAKRLAPSFNVLVDRISRDDRFLRQTLEGVKDYDPFTRKLLELFVEIYCSDNEEESTNNQNFALLADRLGIHRSDYMLNPDEDDGNFDIKQVELNTIASSFAGLAVNVAGLHRQLTTRYVTELKGWMEANQERVMGTAVSNAHDDNNSDQDLFRVGVPQNPALDCIPYAMSLAHSQYQKRYPCSHVDEKPRVILFVVQEGETNTVDQRMLEMKLWENYQIPVVRMSLTRAHTHIELDESTGTLYVRSDDDSGQKQEISVVYFRAGYAPTDYPDGYDGIEWQSRKMIEQSKATKSPCLGYHLAGTKKVQQELARDGTLEQFFDNESIKDEVRSAFAGLFSLGEDATDIDLAAVKDAVSSMDEDGNVSGKDYVLKPQREGGGYNFYGLDLVKKLRDNIIDTGDDDNNSGKIKLDKSLSEFILMQRLFPPDQRSILLRSGMMEGIGDSISELGCFGTVLATHDGTILHNEYAGFLLRTKFSNVDEGGVASGFATLSSPYLC